MKKNGQSFKHKLVGGYQKCLIEVKMTKDVFHPVDLATCFFATKKNMLQIFHHGKLTDRVVEILGTQDIIHHKNVLYKCM